MIREARGSEQRLGILHHGLGEKGEAVEGKAERFDALLGCIVAGSLVTGLASLLAAVLAVLTGAWVGVGLCLAAAALAFGLAANAILRK